MTESAPPAPEPDERQAGRARRRRRRGHPRIDHVPTRALGLHGAPGARRRGGLRAGPNRQARPRDARRDDAEARRVRTHAATPSRGGDPSACRSSCSPPERRNRTCRRASRRVPTTTSVNPSVRRSCERGCRRSSGGVDPMPPIVVVSLAPAIANVLLIIVVVARHLLVGRRTRHVETLAVRLRLPAIELVDGDGPIVPPELNGAETKVFADLLVQVRPSADRGIARSHRRLLGVERPARPASSPAAELLPVEACHGGVRARRCRAAPCCSFACRPARRSGTRRTRCGGSEPRPPRRRRGDRTAHHRLCARTAPPRRRRHGTARHRTTRGRASRRTHASRGFGSPDVGRADHRPHRGRSRHRPRRRPPRRSCRLRPIGVGIGARPARSQRGARRTRSSRSAIVSPMCERRRHERSVRWAGIRRPRL